MEGKESFEFKNKLRDDFDQISNTHAQVARV